MAIKQTITSDWHFSDWLIDARKRDSSYGNCFTPEGAKAVQDYYDQLSDDLGEDIEFDPIAWCCEWTEFDSMGKAYEYHFGNYDDIKDQSQGNRTPEQQLERFEDNTTVITLDNGHVLIQEF